MYYSPFKVPTLSKIFFRGHIIERLLRKRIHKCFKDLGETSFEKAVSIKGSFAEAIVEYDKARDHMLSMADALSAGLVAQFPKKFKNRYRRVLTSF